LFLPSFARAASAGKNQKMVYLVPLKQLKITRNKKQSERQRENNEERK
jgi:hypothetical protein